MTGHRYYGRWSYGLDFEGVGLTIVPFIWEDSRPSVEMVLPHYEVREAIDFFSSVGGKVANETLLQPEANWVMGSNVVYNDTATRQMHFAVNARDGSGGMYIKGHRCVDYCKIDPVIIDNTTTTMYWSDPATWTYLPNRVPLAGEEVIIHQGWDVIFDLEDSPLFKNVEVNGKLTWLRGQPGRLNTHALWVRAGSIDIGTEADPFDSQAEIKLHGNHMSPSEFVFAPHIPVGNKNLIITSQVNMFGKPRQRMSRLRDTIYPNE